MDALYIPTASQFSNMPHRSELYQQTELAKLITSAASIMQGSGSLAQAEIVVPSGFTPRGTTPFFPPIANVVEKYE